MWLRLAIKPIAMRLEKTINSFTLVASLQADTLQ
jgi:hypothetical protein